MSARGWGALALAAWLSLALQLTGVLSFDALNPTHMLGCAPPTRTIRSPNIPPQVSPGLVLVRGDEVESLPPGSVVVLGRDFFALVGADFSLGVIVVEDEHGRLVSLPAHHGALRIQRATRGVRVGARAAGIAGGVLGGMATGLAVGATAASGADATSRGVAAMGGCVIGALAGGAIGTGTSIPLTRDRRYRLGPDGWQLVQPPANAERVP